MTEQFSFQEQCRLTWLKAGRTPFKYLFIHSHMRSGSTLLVHILSSNPDIVGYGETTRTYQSTQDLDWLLLNMADFFKKNRLPQKYVLDKLLQNSLLRDESIIQRDDVKVLFLLRRPEESLPSILNVYKNVYPTISQDLAGDEPESLQYYQDRLGTMARYAREMNDKNRALFLTHEQMLADTPTVFSALKSFLEVPLPFTENYKTHQATGKKVTGDFSDTIKKGHIVRGEKHAYDQVSDAAMRQAIESYERCSADLNKYCTPAKSPQPVNV